MPLQLTGSIECRGESSIAPRSRRVVGRVLLLVTVLTMVAGGVGCQATQNGASSEADDPQLESAAGDASHPDTEPSESADANEEGTAMDTQPRHGFVTDTDAFEAFIETRPDAQRFRAVYPDVQLVMPDDITTREFRSDNSRYFARFDDRGRIVGGSFQ